MQGADWIQAWAVDTDQQNQLSEKQPSAWACLCSPAHSIHPSPPPLHCPTHLSHKWGGLWSADSFLSKTQPWRSKRQGGSGDIKGAQGIKQKMRGKENVGACVSLLDTDGSHPSKKKEPVMEERRWLGDSQESEGIKTDVLSLWSVWSEQKWKANTRTPLTSIHPDVQHTGIRSVDVLCCYCIFAKYLNLLGALHYLTDA